MGLLVDVFVVADSALEVEAVEGVRSLDGPAEMFFDGSDEPLRVLRSMGVEDVS